MSWALARYSAIKLLGGNCEQANEISCGAHWTDLLKNGWKFSLTLKLDLNESPVLTKNSWKIVKKIVKKIRMLKIVKKVRIQKKI